MAGLVGNAGLVDGLGQEARLNRPLALAIEIEPLAQQLERERRQEPPPPIRVLVADFGNGVIRSVREDGQVETVTGASGAAQSLLGAPGRPGRFSPIAVGVDANGNVFFTDGDDVVAVLPDGSVVRAAEAKTFDSPGAVSCHEAARSPSQICRASL